MLLENSVYPTRHSNIQIKDTFVFAAVDLENYEQTKKDENLQMVSQLILDASGTLFQHGREAVNHGQFYKQADNHFEFISVYKSIFPEIDVEKIRDMKKLAPMFAKKTRELAYKFTNPERLSQEQRRDLAHTLIQISNSIRREQYKYNRYM